MSRFIATGFFILFSFFLCTAQEVEKTTELYAVKDRDSLFVDFYSVAQNNSELRPCVIFMFGGGFKSGTRDRADYESYFKHLAKRNFLVASIDYRLGLKNGGKPSVFNQKPLIDAINIAVEDLFTATVFLWKKSDSLKIDKSKIIASGSSAGAIAVLEAIYEHSNRRLRSLVLSEDFKYAGVISFSGALYSKKGTPAFPRKVPPMLFFHGTADKMVPYKSLRFFNRGLFGPASITKVLKKQESPYVFYSFVGLGHQIAEWPMQNHLENIDNFLNNYVLGNDKAMQNIIYEDKTIIPKKDDTPSKFYKQGGDEKFSMIDKIDRFVESIFNAINNFFNRIFSL